MIRQIWVFILFVCAWNGMAGMVNLTVVEQVDKRFSMITDQQFHQLTPTDPAGYLELGEWIWINSTTDEHRRMSVQLLSRAVLWGDQHGQPQVASSACIALSEMVDDQDKRLLWDLAFLIDPSRKHEWLRATERLDLDKETLRRESLECLYAIRYNQQPRGKELFSNALIREKIQQAGELAGIEWERLERLLLVQIERGLEDSCRGRMYIADRSRGGKGGRGGRLVCPDHLRALGMCANDEDLGLFLKVEMVLAGSGAQSWKAAESMSVDEPVILPTIADLVEMMDVEPVKAFYRDGRWVTTP